MPKRAAAPVLCGAEVLVGDTACEAGPPVVAVPEALVFIPELAAAEVMEAPVALAVALASPALAEGDALAVSLAPPLNSEAPSMTVAEMKAISVPDSTAVCVS